MANTTDPFAQSVHGTNPQFLVEKITRLKIYNSTYWKEQCFGLTAETIIDKAVALKYVGGNYGGNIKPCNFLCLVLKMLQLQPEKDIVIQFIMNDDFKYVRALGAFYMRLTGKADDVYKYLEPLLNDYRKLAYRGMNGWQSLHMDEFVDNLIRDELVCDIALPHLIKRMKMEELGVLKPRKSAIELEILDAEKENIAEERNENESSAEKFITENLQHGSVSVSVNGSSSVVKTNSTAVVAKAVEVEHGEQAEESALKNGSIENRDRGQRDSRRYSSRSSTPPGTSRDRGSERRDSRGRDKDRESKRDSKKDSSSWARSRSRSFSDDSGDRRREKDRSASDRYKSSREDSRDRHHDRDRRGDRRDSGKSRSARDRSDSRDSRDRGRDRDRRDKHTSSRDRRRERSYSYSSASDRSSSRDRRHRDSKTSNHSGSSRASGSSKRDRDRSYSRDRSASYDRRDSRDKYSSSSGKRRRSASPSSDRNIKRSSATDSYVEKEKDTIKSKEDILPTSAKTTTSSKPAENKTFDRMFGKKKASSGATSKEIINTKGEKVAITAPEGTVEYWNQIRESLGMSKLK